MTARRTAALLLALVGCVPTVVHAGEAPPFVTLAQGVVVRLGHRPVVYLMDPHGGTDAVDARRGRFLWHTGQASVPLLVHGRRLLGLGTPRRGRTGPRLVVVDAVTGHREGELPSAGIAVPASVGGGPCRSTEVRGLRIGGRDLLLWRTIQSPCGGAPPPPGPNPYPPPIVHEGAVEVDLAHRRVHSLPSIPAGARPWTPAPSASEPHHAAVAVGGVRAEIDTVHAAGGEARVILRRTRGGKQLPDVVLIDAFPAGGWVALSADRRDAVVTHPVASHAPPPPGKPAGYDLEVFDLATGRVRYRVHSAFPPSACLALDHTLVSFTGGAVVLIDVASGRQIYRHAVRDLVYHGPLPP